MKERKKERNTVVDEDLFYLLCVDWEHLLLSPARLHLFYSTLLVGVVPI